MLNYERGRSPGDDRDNSNSEKSLFVAGINS